MPEARWAKTKLGTLYQYLCIARGRKNLWPWELVCLKDFHVHLSVTCKNCILTWVLERSLQKIVTIFLNPVHRSFFIFSGKTVHQWFRNWWPANTCWLLHHQTSSHSNSRSLHGKSNTVSCSAVVDLHTRSTH